MPGSRITRYDEKGLKGKRGATVMAAPFVIPLLNSVDFIAEDDYIADEGDDVAH